MSRKTGMAYGTLLATLDVVFWLSATDSGRGEEVKVSMEDWSFVQWVKLGAIALACFAVVGGIVSQTTEGASGRGLLEGMWKGVEWFLIALVACAALYGAWFGLVWLAGTLNT